MLRGPVPSIKGPRGFCAVEAFTRALSSAQGLEGECSAPVPSHAPKMQPSRGKPEHL